MSWFGEHLSSITEKLSDFTKEVLIDEDTADKTEASDVSLNLAYKDLVNLCKEKEQKINDLIAEKEYLERSIDELDQQHQDAINALLIQKNQVVNENNVLKQEIETKKQKFFETSRIDYNSSDISNDTKFNNLELHSSEFSNEGINLVSILQSVSDSSEDEKFKKQIDLLEKQKHFIHSDTNLSNVLTKIDNYINFLEALHSQSLYSVVDEICSIFNLLVTENSALKDKVKSTPENEDLNLTLNLCTSGENESSSLCNCSTHTKLKCEVSEAFSQTEEDSLVFSQSSTNQKFKINVINQIKSASINSKESQTDIFIKNKSDSLEENFQLSELRSKIIDLEKEKLLHQQNLLQLQTSRNKETCTKTIQTDNIESQFDLSLAQKATDCQAKACNAIQIKLSQELNSLKDELSTNAAIKTAQKLEIESLQKKVDSLENLNHNLQQNIKKTEESDNSVIVSQKMSTQINSASLQQKLEETHMSSLSVNEIKFLQEKLKCSELEKGKLICILNEKTQECSSLKTEVHKLTNIVASEKQALLKLQKDNCNLKQSNEEKSDPELTKEAIRKLSTLIKDKDLEIESLKQKNATLTTLIQNVTSVPEHLQTLMDEKEHLSKQIGLQKAERDKIMLTYNNKDKEWRECTVEVKKLNQLLSDQRKEFDILEQNHLSIAQQYEEKQKSLINAQNEVVVLKQRINELEQQLVDLKEKYGDLLNRFHSNNTIQITKDELNSKNSEIERLICENEEKDHLIQEKDYMIHDLSQEVKNFKLESEQRNSLHSDNQEKISSLTNVMKEINNKSEQLEKEKVVLEQRFQDKCSELDLLKDMNERLNMTVKEKEFAIQSMTEKISSLSQYISSGPSSPGTADVNQILAESETMFSEARKFRRERDETLLALNQSKQENQSLRNEIQRMKSNEIHLDNQLLRLRQHLIEIEENYTNEALKAEEREKSLKEELMEVKRRADITSTAVVDTNQRASVQISSLQEQLSMVAKQRDEALSQVSSLDDKVLQHSTSVNKLQLVLEQIQKGNERKIKDIENKWKMQLEKQIDQVTQLEKQLQIKQMQLEESLNALEAASRLSEQLDAKEEVIANLKSELSKTEHKIKSTAMEIDTIKSNTEGKVDRIVMKSLVLGYFSTPPGQKSEVIRLLARVLDFNQEEMEKAGIIVGKHTRGQENRGIFSSIFNRLPSLSSPEHKSQQTEKSFTTLFVQFLENESQPIVPMPFPAEKMAQELTSKSHLGKKMPQTSSNNSSPSRSPLLLDIDSTFPTFTPIPAVEYSISPAPAILKEVLE